MRKPWHGLRKALYRRHVVARTSDGRIPPVPRQAGLDIYAGEWVAVRNEEVVAHSVSSLDLARQLRSLGSDRSTVVVQRVAADNEALAVGLG